MNESKQAKLRIICPENNELAEFEELSFSPGKSVEAIGCRSCGKNHEVNLMESPLQHKELK